MEIEVTYSNTCKKKSSDGVLEVDKHCLIREFKVKYFVPDDGNKLTVLIS